MASTTLDPTLDRTADLTAAQLLAAAEESVRTQRAVEVERLRLVVAWCDQHSGDPQDQPGAVPVAYGGDKLVQVGGEGTPQVAELCFGELAIALQAGVVATRNLAEDALDLRHRLPLLYTRLVAGECEVWVARRVAKLSRPLSRERVGLVDAAVANALGEGSGRVLAVAEAKVIEADPEAHRARIAAEDAKTGVWLSRTRAGDAIDVLDAQPGTRKIGARLPVGTAVEIDAVLDDLADALAAHTEPAQGQAEGQAEGQAQPSRGELRAQALELLSRPHDAVAFLNGLSSDHADADADADGATDDTGAGASSRPAPRPRRRRSAVIHVHLSALALQTLGRDGVARVEGLGPFLFEQLADLLGRRDIRLQPVIDLNTVQAVSAYEHPTRVRERVLLRHVGDGFPHSTSPAGMTGRVDLDHATPYTSTGPPGQTGDHNATPLTRTHHRIKTHINGFQVQQLGLAAHRWITPHGLARVVTPHGTTQVELLRARDGTIHGETYPQPAHLRIELDLS